MLHKRHFVLCLTFWVQFRPRRRPKIQLRRKMRGRSPNTWPNILKKKCNFSSFYCKNRFFLLISDTALAINTTTQYTSLIANSPVATFARRNPLVIRICFANWGWPRLLLFPQTHELCGSPIDWSYYRSLAIILQNRLIPSLIHYPALCFQASLSECWIAD